VLCALVLQYAAATQSKEANWIKRLLRALNKPQERSQKSVEGNISNRRQFAGFPGFPAGFGNIPGGSWQSIPGGGWHTIPGGVSPNAGGSPGGNAGGKPEDLSVCKGAPNQMSADDKNRILADLNRVRKELSTKEGVTLPPLVWDDTVANMAQLVVNNDATCNPNHGYDTCGNTINLGQNLAAGGIGTGGLNSVEEAVRMWESEKSVWDWSSRDINKCTGGWEKCGHFSQIVWKATTKVGCASRKCGSGDNARLAIACDFYPGGNSGGKAYR